MSLKKIIIKNYLSYTSVNKAIDKLNNNLGFKIKKSLNNSNKSLYNEIFLGYNKKYPLWAGYAIGYYIVKDYLTAKEQLSWSEIFKLTPRRILKESKYLT